ncbi:hypothetical protein AAFF27_08370 [Xylophilus sp. GW821-FHT01B05]
MTSPSTPSDTDADSVRDEDIACTEALLVGTLALMTGHAQACCDMHRETMARKVVVRLQCLARHAAFTPHFRTAVENLQACWLRQAGLDGLVDAGAVAAQAPARELWHVAPEALQ